MDNKVDVVLRLMTVWLVKSCFIAQPLDVAKTLTSVLKSKSPSSDVLWSVSSLLTAADRLPMETTATLVSQVTFYPNS